MPGTTDTIERNSSATLSDLAVQFVGTDGTAGAFGRLAAHGVAACGNGSETRAALVFATVTDAASATRAVRAAARAGSPLVLDLATPWALDGRRTYATALHLRADQRAMRRALGAADLVFVRTPAMVLALADMGVAHGRAIAVPGGCAADDRLPASTDGAFRLWVASGFAPSVDPACATRDGVLRRRPRQIEPAGATSFYLLTALAALRDKQPRLFERVRVTTAPLDHSNRDIVDWLALEDSIEETDGAPAAADAVYVCQHGEVGSARALSLPDGFFRAIGTGRPVLAAVANGDARELMQRHSLGVVLPATDAPPLCHALERLLQKPLASTTPPAWLDADAIAATIAATLRAVAAKAPLPAAAGQLWPATGRTGTRAS